MTKSTIKCSCIVCHEERLASGIHSHYNIAHTIEGNKRHQLMSAASASSGGKGYAKSCEIAKVSKKCKYNSNPKVCKCCSKLHTFETRLNQYCSASCGATMSNKSKPKQTVETRRKRSASMKGKPCTSNPARTTLKYCVCELCNSHFRWDSIHKGSLRFCSNECSRINRSNKARNNPGLGTKRSKLEIELFKLCEARFNRVIPNEKLINGWDADIVIYDTKTAILWNGPWHYREMNFGNHSLKQVQNRDKIKIKEFTNAGWNVIIFEDRYFTPQTAFEYLIRGTGGI